MIAAIACFWRWLLSKARLAWGAIVVWCQLQWQKRFARTDWPIPTITGIIGLLLMLLLLLSQAWPWINRTSAGTADQTPPRNSNVLEPPPAMVELSLNSELELFDSAPRAEESAEFNPFPPDFQSVIPRREEPEPEPFTPRFPDALTVDVEVIGVRSPRSRQDWATRQFDEAWYTVQTENAGTFIPPEFDWRAGNGTAPDAAGDLWDRFNLTRDIGPIEPVAYQSEQVPTQLASALTSNDEPRPGQKDASEATAVQISVERQPPETILVRQINEYFLNIRNNGPESVSHFRIEEVVPESHRIIAVEPAANLEGNVLNWVLTDLQSGESRRLRVQFFPTEEGTTESVTRIQTVAAVSSQSIVTGAKLNLEIDIAEQVEQGDALPIRFRVTNGGTAAVQNVVLNVDLPSELDYHYTRKLKYSIGDLPAGKTHTSRLTAKTAREGLAIIYAAVSTPDEIHSQATAESQVLPRTSPPAETREPIPTGTLPDPSCLCEPIIRYPR